MWFDQSLILPGREEVWRGLRGLGALGVQAWGSEEVTPDGAKLG